MANNLAAIRATSAECHSRYCGCQRVSACNFRNSSHVSCRASAPVLARQTNIARGVTHGILTVTGSILDVGNIDTSDADGILNVAHFRSSNGFASIGLGGEIHGGTITLDNSLGLRGHGLVSAPIINNTRVEASGTLTLVTAANNNDWDGTINTGALAVVNQGTLVVPDTQQTGFGGVIESRTAGGTIRIAISVGAIVRRTLVEWCESPTAKVKGSDRANHRLKRCLRRTNCRRRHRVKNFVTLSFRLLAD